jgi:hypothetical protein
MGCASSTACRLANEPQQHSTHHVRHAAPHHQEKIHPRIIPFARHSQSAPAIASPFKSHMKEHHIVNFGDQVHNLGDVGTPVEVRMCRLKVNDDHLVHSGRRSRSVSDVERAMQLRNVRSLHTMKKLAVHSAQQPLEPTAEIHSAWRAGDKTPHGKLVRNFLFESSPNLEMVERSADYEQPAFSTKVMQRFGRLSDYQLFENHTAFPLQVIIRDKYHSLWRATIMSKSSIAIPIGTDLCKTVIYTQGVARIVEHLGKGGDVSRRAVINYINNALCVDRIHFGPPHVFSINPDVVHKERTFAFNLAQHEQQIHERLRSRGRRASSIC